MKKIAIVGVEGSGKTVLMAVMGDKYESPDANGVFLQPMNRETYSYYTKETAKLRDGQWPFATESSVLELDWMLKRQSGPDMPQEQLGQISFLDFGGEIYRIAFADKSQEELEAIDKARMDAAERLKSHVREADVLIVLVNLNDILTGKRGEMRTIEMNWLSQSILSYAFGEAGKTSVAIVFTQSEQYANIIEGCGGLRGTLATHMRPVNSSYGNRLTLFAVSAVSKTITDGSGRLIPASDFEPQGLELLMGWVVHVMDTENRRREEARIAAAKAEEDARRRKRNRTLCAIAAALMLGGCVSAWIAYEKGGDFSRWVDGRFESLGLKERETNDLVTGSRNAQSVIPDRTLPKRPIVAPEPPKPEEPKWIVGTINPNNPHLVAGESRNTWVATRPGYVWVKGTDRGEWKQGVRHPENSKLVSDRKEGEWKSTQAGYVWTGGNQTEWRENLKHPDWPHVLSSPEENNWHTEEGYKWVNSDAKNDFSVVWNPGVIVKGRKTGNSEGLWLKKCSACGGRGKKDCWKCDGDGRINCTSCSGSGRVETTESERCWKCNGRGRINDSCPDENSMLHTLNPMHVYYGKHVRPCWTCGTQGGTAGPWGIVPCSNCMGKGCTLCPTCGGSNRVVVDCNNCDNGYRTRQTTKNCSSCSGRGTVICPRSECHGGKVSCSSCNGEGWVAE